MRSALAFVVFACVPGCGPAERLGEPLASGLGGGGQAFEVLIASEDGRFVTGGTGGLHAIDDAGEVTVLDPGPVHFAAALSRSDEVLFTPGECLLGCPVRVVRIAAAGGAGTTVLEGVRAVGLHTVVVSPDDTRLAYIPEGAADTPPVFRVHTLATGEDVPVAAAYPVAFSPDGDEVLVHTGTPRGEAVVTVAGGASRPIAFDYDPEVLDRLIAMAWTSEGIVYVVLELRAAESGNRWVVHRGESSSPARVEVWSHEDEITGPFRLSPDGRRLALWTRRCLERGSIFSCERWRFTLHHLDLMEKKARRLAWTETDVGVPEHRRDGETLGLLHAGALYVYGTPR